MAIDEAKPVRWGILGASHFATAASVPAFKAAPLTEVVAVASRSLERAQKAASDMGVPHAYGSYEELIAADDIDVIYNPLANHLHVPWSIRAAQAGKHVLCEKPISLDAGGAKQLQEAAQAAGVLVTEAFMVVDHPQWAKARELIQGGRIGQLRAVQTAFSYSNSDLTNIRNKKDLGGGALYDIGGYAIRTARYLFGSEPKRVAATCDRDPQSDCDRLTTAILDFGMGQASFVVGTQHVAYQRVHAFGTEGHLEVEIPFNAPNNRPCRIFLDAGDDGGPDFTLAANSDSRRETITLPQVNQYTLQAEAFSRAVRGGPQPSNTLDTAVRNMQVIDAIFRACSSGRWEEVG